MGEQISVPTRILGRFRAATEADPPRSGPDFRAAALRLREMPAALRPPEALLDFLLEMDRKLDAILGCLHRESLREIFPGEGWITALSATRLTLETTSPLNGGDRLELALLLEEFPPRMAVVAATVEAETAKNPPGPGAGPGAEETSTEAERTAAGLRTFRLAYACAREEDQETLIRFIFQEERRLLRRRKGDGP
jgi:hypothetical protein